MTWTEKPVALAQRIQRVKRFPGQSDSRPKLACPSRYREDSVVAGKTLAREQHPRTVAQHPLTWICWVVHSDFLLLVVYLYKRDSSVWGDKSYNQKSNPNIFKDSINRFWLIYIAATVTLSIQTPAQYDCMTKHPQNISGSNSGSTSISVPIPSMYGIFTYIYHKIQPNGKYTVHGWYGV